MKTSRTISTLTILVLLVAWNTVVIDTQAADEKIDLSDVKITKETVGLWKEHCASCHGMDGKGKTKAGRKAKVKDLTDKEYQASFTDTQGFMHTKNGMKNKKGKELMKPFAEKVNDQQLKQLMKFLRILPERAKK